MDFHRLWPPGADVEIEAHVAGLDFPALAARGRPCTVVNFISSLDGRATLDGRSGGLGDEGDRALFWALRGAVDAVLVGTGTLAVERYRRLVREPAARERRRQRGLAPEPLLCTVTRSGELPLATPIFSEPEARVVVFSAAPVSLEGARAQVEVVELAPAKLSFAAVLAHLRADHGVRALLCEGGPGVYGALLREGLGDRLFLSLAPKLTGGGTGLAITRGPALPEPLELELANVLERGGTLFLDYERSGVTP